MREYAGNGNRFSPPERASARAKAQADARSASMAALLDAPTTADLWSGSPARTDRNVVIRQETSLVRRPRKLGLLVTVLGVIWSPVAFAQTATGAASLRILTQDADAVVAARIVAGRAEVDAGGVAYPVVHADVQTPLKGAATPGPLVFANVGAGIVGYADGEEVLLFLRHVERVAELAATPLQHQLRYVVMPNAGEKLVLTPWGRAPLLDAVRRYAAVQTIQDPEVRGEAIRSLTLDLLKSGDPVLIASVMRDFEPGGDAAALTLADLPAMVPLIESPRVPIGTRIAVVAELERRGLVFGPARWVRLLRTSQGPDLLAVIRAVGQHPSAGVTGQLVPLLHERDLAVATAAASSLGVPGNVDAVRPLAAALARRDWTLRRTILTSLTRIGTQSARQAIELVAARHPDAELRARAETEAIILARRHGTTLAAMLGGNAADALKTN